MIRVVIAEDSATSRELLEAVLSGDPEIEVVGVASNGAEAVALVRALKPDVVTMDIRMPVMDGFEATKAIMIETPTPVVIVTSRDVRDVQSSMRALRLGALTAIAKPSGPLSPRFARDAQELVETVKAMSQVSVVRQVRGMSTPEPQARPAGDRGAAHGARGGAGRAPRAKVVALAASTGGPQVLHRVLAGLPARLDAPLMIVQHIATGFSAGLTDWLASATALKVRLATPGAALEPGTAYVAPTDLHLGAGPDRTVELATGPPVDGFRPSASRLFESVGRVYGASALGVVLSGMGHDGVAGLRVIKAAGGQVIAQDQASSVIFGMPGAAIEAGLADHVLSPEGIIAQIIRLVEGEDDGGGRVR